MKGSRFVWGTIPLLLTLNAQFLLASTCGAPQDTSTLSTTQSPESGQTQPGHRPDTTSQDFEATLEQATAAIVSHEYRRALDLLRRAERMRPGSPLPRLLRAATVHAEMQDLEQPKLEPVVQALLDSAEMQLDTLLANHDPTPTELFAAGSLHAYRAYEAVRHHSYFSAYRHGLKANHFFKAALRADSTYCDARIGVGSFQYWRSRALRPISWLPFIPDEREEGLLNLEQALACARLARWTGLSDLAWMLLDAGEPAKAWRVASDGLRFFPHSRFYLWPAAEASYRLGNWKDSEAKFRTILEGLRHTKASSGYNEVVCLVKIAEIQKIQGRPRAALATLEELRNFPLPPETVARAKHLLKRAESLQRELEKSLNVRQGSETSH